MTDAPPSRRARLSTLLAAGREHARTREPAAALDVADEVASLADAVDDEELGRRLVHGCVRVRATAADEPLVAAEYFDSMADLVADAERSDR